MRIDKDKPASFMEITQEDFQAYEDVRRSGLWNMYSSEAREDSGLSESTYRGVMKHYKALMEKFPGVRKLS